MSLIEIIMDVALLSGFALVGSAVSRPQSSRPEEFTSPAPLPDGAASLESLREQHQVRIITEAEEGFATSQLPNGVYGFTYAPALDRTPLFRRKTFQSFEVHKLPNGAEHLIGFVTPAEQEKLARRPESLDLNLYPEPYGPATALVTIPTTVITNSKRTPSRDQGNFLKLNIDLS